MMKSKILYLLLALLAVCTTANAQTKKKKTVRKVQQVKVEPTPEEILYEDMLPSTARVMFIDSMVTDKSSFLNAVALSSESGSLKTYNDFWKATGQDSAYTYMNEFGNKVLFSKHGNDGHSQLYTADKLNGQWSSPKAVTDFGAEFEDVNCPYMMSDGITLYFAAKGKNGIGGYDIYVTMYDTDSARFYKPENIGLPYNSHGNDYYYVIDEFNSIGWLVTDRNQPEDKVCIYTFIPSESRQTYNETDVDEEQLRRLAAISSIKDTWTDQNKLQAARNRLASLKSKNSATKENSINFYINDKLVYSSPSDFKVAENRQRYARLTATKDELAKLVKRTDALRKQYSAAPKAERSKLTPAITKAEQQAEQTELYIRNLEKEIRNAENTALNKR